MGRTLFSSEDISQSDRIEEGTQSSGQNNTPILYDPDRPGANLQWAISFDFAVHEATPITPTSRIG